MQAPIEKDFAMLLTKLSRVSMFFHDLSLLICLGLGWLKLQGR